MKKIILVLVMIFLAGCASNSELSSALAEIKGLESQITQKDNEITDLKYEVETLKLSAASLQNEYDELKDKRQWGRGSINVIYLSCSYREYEISKSNQRYCNPGRLVRGTTACAGDARNLFNHFLERCRFESSYHTLSFRRGWHIHHR